MRCQFADGSYHWMRIICKTIYDEEQNPLDAIGKLSNIDSEMAKKDRLRDQAQRDGLTRLYNAESSRELMTDQLSTLQMGERCALLILDIDHFKSINDTYGHLAGDAALSRAAQAIRSAIRTGDELVRYGGDEFLLLFHDMPRNALKKKLESIRAAVESLEFPEYPGLRITVSIGCAHAVGPLADTVQKADQALYHAKAAKNRTVLYKEDLQ